MNPALNDNDNPILQTVSEPLQQLLNQRAQERSVRKAGATEKTVRFRPARRPPLGFLTILDDGCDSDGELLRVRTTEFTIGRSEGDITIPFDPDLSGLHAALECRHHKGQYQWFLVDRNSRNGTFLRAYRARPRDGAELIIGSRRYEFQTGLGGLSDIQTDPDHTFVYEKPTHDQLPAEPRIIEVTGSNTHGTEFRFPHDPVTVGQSPDCDVHIADDPLVSAVHARFATDQQHRWIVEDQKSLNGIWIRVRRMALAHQAEFQLGQQRFLFEVR